MVTIEFEIDEKIAQALAFSRGWQPYVEDSTQELVGDEYPIIPNPISYKKYVSGIVSAFLIEHVISEGRKGVMVEFTSIYDSIDHVVSRGDFDEMIISGNIEGIKAAIKSNI